MRVMRPVILPEWGRPSPRPGVSMTRRSVHNNDPAPFSPAFAKLRSARGRYFVRYLPAGSIGGELDQSSVVLGLVEYVVDDRGVPVGGI